VIPAHISPAQTETEVDLALELAIPIFKRNSNINDDTAYKAMLWRDDPSYATHNILLARHAKGILGLVRIVPRRLYRGTQIFSVAGISSVCIDEEFRGIGLSIPLMEQALAICKDRGFDFAFLFARRAVDHYYTRFGFHGISAYNQLLIPRTKPPKTNTKFILKSTNDSHIRMYASVYENCYSKCFGRIHRTAEDWAFLLKKLEVIPGLSFATIYADDIPVGYILWDDERVYEIAFEDGISGDQLLDLLMNSLPMKNGNLQIDLELPPQHTLVKTVYGIDMRLSARECPYGGHMASVLNTDVLLEKVAERSVGDFRHIAPLSQKSQFTHHDTCSLLGAWSPTLELSVESEFLPLNISLPDQF
jgi:predicted GNAT family N-acyltransferase